MKIVVILIRHISKILLNDIFYSNQMTLLLYVDYDGCYDVCYDATDI